MKWLILLPIIVIAFIVGVSLYLQPNSFIGCEEKPTEEMGACAPVDAIVVISGGDTRARTAEAIKLFQNGWAEKIVMSGAAQDKMSISNAAAMRLQALDAGIPETAILLDETSENTEQNAANSQSIFEAEGFQKVILVTSGYHQRRASLEFDKRSGDIQVLNHPLLFDQDWSPWWWLSPRGWWLAGGELAKITAFYIQGATQ